MSKMVDFGVICISPQFFLILGKICDECPLDQGLTPEAINCGQWAGSDQNIWVSTPTKTGTLRVCCCWPSDNLKLVRCWKALESCGWKISVAKKIINGTEESLEFLQKKQFCISFLTSKRKGWSTSSLWVVQAWKNKINKPQKFNTWCQDRKGRRDRPFFFAEALG